MADVDEAVASRRAKWVPEPRPEWVATLNEEGQWLDIEGVVPLDENSLLDTARRNTDLADFGDDGWFEPFQVFLKSLKEDARLNLMGRIMTRAEILVWLELRLRVHEEYRLHPEIADEQIVKPLLIMGQGRTGTSAMQNLLSADPNNGTLMTWEAFFPSPPPTPETYWSDPRIERADKLITRWYRVTPELEAMHEFGGAIPTEGIHMACSSFQAPTWMNFMGQVSSYNAYMYGKSMKPALEWEKKILRLLQWKNPRKNWVMKSPTFIYMMPEMLEAYPDACFIWTHRDPIKALASAINMVGALFWQRSDHPYSGGALESSVDENVVAASLNQAVDWLEQGVVPAERLCNIQYGDFVDDPMACVRKIYGQFDIPLTPEGEAAMRQYTRDNAREKRPAHVYSGDTSGWVAGIRPVYRRYQDFFGVPNEL